MPAVLLIFWAVPNTVVLVIAAIFGSNSSEAGMGLLGVYQISIVFGSIYAVGGLWRLVLIILNGSSFQLGSGFWAPLAIGAIATERLAAMSSGTFAAVIAGPLVVLVAQLLALRFVLQKGELGK